MKIVVCQRWIERERGWGHRPDGYSLHLGLPECRNYIKEYWDSMPPYAPDEYSSPVGEPYLCKVEDTVFQCIVDNGGWRSYDTDYPVPVPVV